MYIPDDHQRRDEKPIVLTSRSDIDFWCHRFSISPFTLFYLLKTVGNSAGQIGEFLRKSEGDQTERLEVAGESNNNISIL
jgi:hypothetical protein